MEKSPIQNYLLALSFYLLADFHFFFAALFKTFGRQNGSMVIFFLGSFRKRDGVWIVDLAVGVFYNTF